MNGDRVVPALAAGFVGLAVLWFVPSEAMVLIPVAALAEILWWAEER